MYSSNDEKMKRYKRNLALEDKNIQHQADKLDEYLLAQKGIDTQNEGIAKFAKAIGDEVSATISDSVKPVDKSKALPPATMDDMGIVRTSRRVKTRQAAAEGSNDIHGTTMAVKEGKKPANKGLVKSPPTMTQTNTPLENQLMAAEDKLLWSDPALKSTPATQSQKDQQAIAQAELDLISLFQQDVKEGRKRETRRALEQLTIDQDTKIRQNMMATMDELVDRMKTNRQTKERKLIESLMNAIETQRLADGYEQFVNNVRELASKEDMEKVFRNMTTLVRSRKFNKHLATKNEKKGRDAAEVSGVMNDMLNFVEGRAKVNESIKEKMARLRAIQKEKRERSMSTSTDATDLGSIADVSVDTRRYTKTNIPMNDTNAELETFIDLLKQFDETKGKERSEVGKKINNIINRQKAVNPGIATRMENLRTGFFRSTKSIKSKKSKRVSI